MRRKGTAVRHPEPLPPLLVGEGEAAAPVWEPAAIVAPRERAIAALLPDDLPVVIERTSTGRLLLIAAGLLGSLALWWTGTEGMYILPGQILFAGAPSAMLAWLANRFLVRRRREFRLVDDGIEVEVGPLAVGAPRVTWIPWAEIEDYDVSVDHEKAFLRVMSVRGFTLTLHDRPPRLVTRELIRRFVEQAERHPRAVPPQPRAEGARFPDVTGEYALALRACLAFLALTFGAATVETVLEPSFAQKMTWIAAVGLAVLGVLFWFELDDAEIARHDVESTRPIARLRTWLRRTLGIRAT